MLLLEVIKPLSFHPVSCELNPENIADNQNVISFYGGFNKLAEKGAVVLIVRLLEGRFDGVSEVLFNGIFSVSAKLLSWKDLGDGTYQIKTNFEILFSDGLEHSASFFIVKNILIVGLSQKEKENLKNNIETQKELLGLLTNNILPSRRQEIEAFGMPCILCFPNEGNDGSLSHFIGQHKSNTGELITNRKGTTLLHLCTLNLNDFDGFSFPASLKNYLSFYIKIKHLMEEGWIRENHDNQVLNYDHLVLGEREEEAVNFHWRYILDLPKLDHSLFFDHRFTEEENDKYEILYDIFNQILLGQVDEGQEFNKILGYPNNIQNCVAYEAERVFHQREFSDDIYVEAVNWQLLLQVSPYCKWFSFFDEFGDASIFVMIQKEDLKNGNFENIQVISQCT